MQFFEPSSYEVFVSRLASYRCQPPEEVWHKISERLDEMTIAKKQQRTSHFAYAAGFVLLVFVGYTATFLRLIPPLEPKQALNQDENAEQSPTHPTQQESNRSALAYSTIPEPSNHLERNHIPQKQNPIAAPNISMDSNVSGLLPSITTSNQTLKPLTSKDVSAIANHNYSHTQPILSLIHI